MFQLGFAFCYSEKMEEVSEKKRIMVTGGSGLVGHGIRIVSEQDKRSDEEFIFLSSKDADLT